MNYNEFPNLKNADFYRLLVLVRKSACASIKRTLVLFYTPYKQDLKDLPMVTGHLRVITRFFYNKQAWHGSEISSYKIDDWTWRFTIRVAKSQLNGGNEVVKYDVMTITARWMDGEWGVT